MFGSIRKSPEHRAAVARVTEQTRERFQLSAAEVILVSEVVCALPGCPPIETVILFWNKAGVRHRFKVFKPVTQVGEDDLPYRWLLPGLVSAEGSEDDCC